MKIKRKKGFFSISAVAKMFSVHQQTIRLYEKQGLITPQRSSGNTRLFSEEDVDRLEEVIYLTHQLGINLAGVEMILKLKKQIKKLQDDMNKVFEKTQLELGEQEKETKLLAKASATQLLKIKQQKKMEQHDPGSEKTQQIEIDCWEIEYDQD